eukprot:3054600-Amphidinium_carterae.1
MAPTSSRLLKATNSRAQRLKHAHATPFNLQEAEARQSLTLRLSHTMVDIVNASIRSVEEQAGSFGYDCEIPS